MQFYGLFADIVVSSPDSLFIQKFHIIQAVFTKYSFPKATAINLCNQYEEGSALSFYALMHIL